MKPYWVVPKRVLVVDDEPDFLATYERLLQRGGCEVTAATTRDGALSAVGRQRFDLVISDLRLPDGDGLDIVRAARALSDPPPVIVVTGFPSDSVRRAALGAGAATFLAKPFSAAALLDAIRPHLQGSAPPT